MIIPAKSRDVNSPKLLHLDARRTQRDTCTNHGTMMTKPKPSTHNAQHSLGSAEKQLIMLRGEWGMHSSLTSCLLEGTSPVLSVQICMH